MIIAYKFRLWTTPNQDRALATILETHRRLYNDALAQRQEAYDSRGVSVSFMDQTRWLALERKTHPYLSKTNSKSCQWTLLRLHNAYESFFRRVRAGEKPGYPRFKGRDRFNSFTFQNGDGGAQIKGAKIRVQHVGLIRICMHRPIQGRVKTLTIRRDAEKWYLTVSCDLGDMEIPTSKNPPVGVDVGLESFATTSDGEHVPNPRLLKKEIPELRRRQRALSRAKRGSNRRKKAKRKVARLHRRVANLRKEHHHKVALSLVRRYGLVAVERLNIQGMMRNRRLARSISDAGWYGFVSILKFKAEKAGVSVVEVDPRGTSQSCSGCGSDVQKALSVRHHDCPHCGLSIHRDINAARNILARARLARTEPAKPKPSNRKAASRSQRPTA